MSGTLRQGVIYSAAFLMGAYGEESYAVELLKTAFKDWADIMRSRPDPYDLEKIAHLEKYFTKRETT